MINEEKKDIEIPREWAESIIFYEQEDSKKYFGISKYPIIDVNEEEFIKDKIKFLKLLKPLLIISKFDLMDLFCKNFPKKCFNREYPFYYGIKKYITGKTPKYSNYGGKLINELLEDSWIIHEVISGKHHYKVNSERMDQITQLKE